MVLAVKLKLLIKKNINQNNDIKCLYLGKSLIVNKNFNDFERVSKNRIRRDTNL